jgi:flagellar hook-basal body complex protein FliE
MIDRLQPASLAPAAPTKGAEVSPLAAPSVAPGTGALDGASADFTAMLGDLMTNAAATVKHAEAASIAGIKGQASVQQVVEAVMSAEQNLQGAIAVRDKVVSAYLELSRMQI